MPVVQLPVYGDVEFPDSMSEEDIVKAIEQDIFKGQMRQYSKAETARMGLERGFTSSARTLAGDRSEEVTPGYEDPLTSMMSVAPISSTEETDEQKELKFRIARDQNPITGYGTQILGSIFDPAGLAIPLGRAATFGSFVKQGVGTGAIGGVLEPTYEQFGDSRLENIAYGAAGGGLLTAAVGKAFKKQLFPDEVAAKTVPDDGPKVTETPTSTLVSQADEPDIKPSIVEDPITLTDEISALPKLPQYLSGLKPRFAKSEISFESDLDAALYAVGNPKTKSARHDDYMQFLQQSLQLPEDEVVKLAAAVRKEVIEAGMKAQKDAGMAGQKTLNSFTFNLSSNLDNLLFPVTRKLDDSSKFVYNFGKAIQPDAKGLYRINERSPDIQTLVTKVKEIDPTFTSQDAVLAARGYSQLLDTMKTKMGREFKPRSFDDMLVNKLDEESWIRLFNEGAFDGC
jgi:hypothetical protein